MLFCTQHAFDFFASIMEAQLEQLNAQRAAERAASGELPGVTPRPRGPRPRRPRVVAVDHEGDPVVEDTPEAQADAEG